MVAGGHNDEAFIQNFQRNYDEMIAIQIYFDLIMKIAKTVSSSTYSTLTQQKKVREAEAFRSRTFSA